MKVPHPELIDTAPEGSPFNGSAIVRLQTAEAETVPDLKSGEYALRNSAQPGIGGPACLSNGLNFETAYRRKEPNRFR